MAKKKDAPQEVQLIPIAESAPELKIVEGTSPELTPEQQSAQAWMKGEPETPKIVKPKPKAKRQTLGQKIRDYLRHGLDTHHGAAEHFGITVRQIKQALNGIEPKLTPKQKVALADLPKKIQAYSVANPTLSHHHIGQHFKTSIDVVVKALGLPQSPPDNGETTVAKKKEAAKKTTVRIASNKNAGPTGKGRVKGVNKSKLIEADLTKTPDAKPADLATKHGVSEGLVQAIRRKMGLTKKGKGKGGRPKGSKNKAASYDMSQGHNGHPSHNSQHGFISAAFALGLDKAQELLDQAKKLLG